MILHLLLNPDDSLLQIDILPFEAKAFIDSQTAVPPKDVGCFSIRPSEMFFNHSTFFFGIRIFVSLLTHRRLYSDVSKYPRE